MPAIGRNVGAGQASAEILGFVDSDAYAGEDWAAKIVAAYQEGCRVGGGSLHLPPEQRRNPLALVQYFIQFNEFMETGKRRAVKFTPSCNLFCEKKLFEETGGFPEIRAAEDVLFGLGLADKETFWFEPKIRVWHIFLDTWKRYRTNQVLLGQYTLEYRRQHYKKWFYRGLWPIVFLPVFLGGKFLKIAWRVCKCPDNELRFAFFLYLPLFLMGMFFLGWGVAKTCFKKDK
jgi:glycosyltransferase involved in cell wall biosynthesis